MRFWTAICVSLLFAGCAEFETTKPKVIVKTVTKVVVKEAPTQPTAPAKIVYVDKCPPPAELSAHCNAIRTREACDAEQRCHWAEGPKNVAHCRRLHCKPGGKQFPR